MTIESKRCPKCRANLSKHAPAGYCPDCSSKIVNSAPEANPDDEYKDLFVVRSSPPGAGWVGQYAGQDNAKASSAVASVDSLGIDVLLVTHEELAAIAAERPEINAALILGPCTLTWHGILVVPCPADAIDQMARDGVEIGRRVARLQPGHGLKPSDPKWQQIAQQEPPKPEPVWQRWGASPWHWFPDGESGAAACGSTWANPSGMESRTTRPPEIDICQYCWAITCDSLVSSIDTEQLR